MKNLIRIKLETNDLDKDIVIQLLRSYISIYLTGALTDQIIQTLNLQMGDILASSYVANDMEIVMQLLDYLNEYIIANSQTIGIYKPICYILQMIISTPCTNANNIFDILEKEIRIIDHIVSLIKQLIVNTTDATVILTM
jgi:hypothetical protein